jgi:hypothetical protein
MRNQGHNAGGNVTKAKAQAACYLPLLESASPTLVMTYNKETKEFVPDGNKATWEHFQAIYSKGWRAFGECNASVTFYMCAWSMRAGLPCMHV